MKTAQFRELASAVLRQLPKEMDATTAQGWIDNPRALRNFLVGLCSPEKTDGLLTPFRQVTVGPLTKPFDPHAFFQNGERGIWVSPEFRDRVLSATTPTKEGAATSLQAFNLTKSTLDSQIRSELAEDHLVELWQIATLIGKQPKGKKGPLLTNGYANLFYVKGKDNTVFVVHVLWRAGDREWDVDAWSLGEYGEWDSEGRVFSRN